MACNNPSCSCKGGCACRSGRPCHCTAGEPCPGCATASTGAEFNGMMSFQGQSPNDAPPPEGQRTPDLVVFGDAPPQDPIGRRYPAAPPAPPPDSLYHGRVERGDWNWGGTQMQQTDGMGLSDSDPLNEAAWGPWGKRGRPEGDWHAKLDQAVRYLLGKSEALRNKIGASTHGGAPLTVQQASARMAAKGQGPYGYLIEFALALGTLTPTGVRILGFDPAVFAPLSGFKSGKTYMGADMAPPPPKPYNNADPIILALTRGAARGAITYKQLDLMGIHPCYLPGAGSFFQACR
jgi:hypothetical protein